MSRLSLRKPDMAAECVATQKAIMPAIKRNARKMGYAVAIHGSQLRDIDLVAIPWTDNALSAKSFVRYLYKVVALVNPKGRVFMSPSSGLKPSQKPNGRQAWSIHIGWHTYIDLSVMPRISKNGKVFK